MEFFKANKSSKHKTLARVVLSLISSAVLFLILAGIPKSPFTIIGTIKKKSISNIELILPINKLSENLSVYTCSDESLKTLYSTAKNINAAKSGLSAFKARLSREYKGNSKNFSKLATKVLSNSAVSANQGKACLLPLKISADDSLEKQIATADLLEVALGNQSIFCSNKKAFFANNSKFYPVDSSIASYSKYINDKKIVLALKNQQATLQRNKAKLAKSKKAEKEKIDEEIRKLTISMRYALYFSKDGSLLGSFFNEICKQASVVATPKFQPQAPVDSTAVPTPVVRAPTATPTRVFTAIPTKTATVTPSRTATVAATATKTSTENIQRIATPQIQFPAANNTQDNRYQLGAGVNQITIKWSRVLNSSNKAKYLVRAINSNNNSILTSVHGDPNNYTAESITLTGLPPDNYRFWVHSAQEDVDLSPDSITYSFQADFYFTVSSSTTTITATPTRTPTQGVSQNPIITVTPTRTPTLPSGTARTIQLGAVQLITDRYDTGRSQDMSAPTLRKSNTEYYTWVENGDFAFEKYIGTIANPYQTRVWSDSGTGYNSHYDRWDFSGFLPKTNYNHYRPWMPNIYKHNDGTLIGVVHIETTNWDDSNCLYRQGIAISSQAIIDKAKRDGKIGPESIIGDYWKYVGDVIKPNFDGPYNKGQNLGGAPLLIVGDYLYQYFNETPAPAGSGPRIPAVARARIDEVVDAAKRGTVSPWMKYNNGLWNQPGLTGLGSNILPGTDRYDMHTDAVFSTALNKYILVAWEQTGWDFNTFRQSPGNRGYYIYTSDDGVNWGNKIHAYTPSDGSPSQNDYNINLDETNPYPFFVGLNGGTDDFNVLNGDIFLFFPDIVNHKLYRLPINFR